MRDTSRGPLRPHLVATGFTTALLGDERTLREFLIGDHVVARLRARGVNAILYLVNDSYDPLDERQLRIGVNKDAALVEKFRPFCGRPIAEIPDPFECHASYAEHFARALLDRLHAIDVHPILFDTYSAYRAGQYATFVARTFERYEEIQRRLQSEFELPPRDLFHPQCPQCHGLDQTSILSTGPVVTHRCARCGLERRDEVALLRGKLGWKLDCAARWNLYGIDTEVFAKAHLADKGTYNVARLVSREWFGGHVPEAIKYGDLRIERPLLGRLIPMLPPAVLKGLLVEPIERDLAVTRKSLEHLAESFEIRPGTSYARFVREELPRRVLETAADGPDSTTVDGRGIVAHAIAYAAFMYGRQHGLRWPSRRALEGARPGMLEAARDAVATALELRREAPAGADLRSLLKQRLTARPMPGVYPFLRRVLGQDHGPSITTLLALLPLEYLETIHLILDACARAALRTDARDAEAPARKAA